jgi:hypothetical protein
MQTEFDKNIQYAQSIHSDLMNQYSNKYVLIRKQKIVNRFDSYQNAFEQGVEMYGMGGDFIVYCVE